MADEQPEKLILTSQDVEMLKSTAANLVARGGTVMGPEGAVQDLARAFDWLNRQGPGSAGPSA